jgi:hypothetical protein
MVGKIQVIFKWAEAPSISCFVTGQNRSVTCLLDVFAKEEFDQSQLMLFATSKIYL